MDKTPGKKKKTPGGGGNQDACEPSEPGARTSGGWRLRRRMYVVRFAFGGLGVWVFQLLSAQQLTCCIAIALHAATAKELTANFAAAAEVHARGAASSSASGLGRVCRTETCGASMQVKNICQANYADEAS